ncbi:MAG TPA: 50S ribosomal protein L15 [Verrucomicrobiae bacterium]|nr:50S ribosomal protein L15 [Verrucomicrobiae bacterium]
MQLHDLRSPEGSRRPRVRAGRGIAAGRGKTSGRGQKGQGARSSWSVPRAFEGGQMPLTQRVPKLRGFTNRFRITYAIVNCGKLLRFASGSVVDPVQLALAGLIPSPRSRVKLLAAGPAPAGLTIRVHRASRAARAAIVASGGTVELLDDAPSLAPEAAVSVSSAAGEDDPPAAP